MSENKTYFLAKYGYAPGDYTGKCKSCGKTFMGEKRARTCHKCARGMYDIDINAKDKNDGPIDYYLPKITPEIFQEFGGLDFLIESDNGKNMQWSQMAVDFLVMINNSNRKERNKA